MDSINFPALFDDFIVAPNLKSAEILKWFKEHDNGTGIYTIFNQQFQPLYVGCSVNLKRRLGQHRSQNKLEGHFDEVLFIGIKFVHEGDPTPKERQFIRELKPLLNKHRYGGERPCV